MISLITSSATGPRLMETHIIKAMTPQNNLVRRRVSEINFVRYEHSQLCQVRT
jgi:hypothetical protein